MADVLPYDLFVTDVKSLLDHGRYCFWCRLMLCLLWCWTDVMSIWLMLLPNCVTIGGLGLMLYPCLIMADVIAMWQME